MSALRELLGPTARYTQHSDLHAHRGGVGWHRDSACRTFGEGPDWDESHEPYQVVRVAIYLQTYAESHSALGVIPGSHRYEKAVGGREAEVWRRVIALREIAASTWGRFTRGERLPHEMRLRNFPQMLIRTRPRAGSLPWPPPEAPVWIRTEPGDCVIFNQRLYHSAIAIGRSEVRRLPFIRGRERARAKPSGLLSALSPRLELRPARHQSWPPGLIKTDC